ncbi:MAG TPA: hypothetical protein VFR87_08260 [Nocardioidaceae bacterium]|nr:hypothetical protein [Nocardioidaceae bacterium]
MTSSRRASAFAIALGGVLLTGLAAVSTPGGTSAPAGARSASASVVPAVAAARVAARRPELPQGGRRIYPGHLLVAYYGTATTPTMGVLGEDTPDRITERLREAAAPFARDRWKVQVVYELIVTIADRDAGTDGDYSHDIAREHVERYLRAARRNKALLVLDLQPGRSGFLEVAKRWQWALERPWVGLALDPEWRMDAGQVPAETIGQVSAAEVNRVSGWLARIARRNDHPQKLLLLHQFRRDMVLDIEDVVPRKRLAVVQHVDGFGSQSQKLSTYGTVAQPEQFTMGFKLFYDEDTDLMTPVEVLRLRPRVRFVSYQ